MLCLMPWAMLTLSLPPFSFLPQASDAPRYKKANTGLIAVICFNLVILYPSVWYYYRRRNAQKSAIWDNMTSKEKTEYLATTKDEGNKRCVVYPCLFGKTRALTFLSSHPPSAQAQLPVRVLDISLKE